MFPDLTLMLYKKSSCSLLQKFVNLKISTISLKFLLGSILFRQYSEYFMRKALEIHQQIATAKQFEAHIQ